MVRVRFAPSPTGYLHVGGARTALYNYLFAKKHGGQFIVRVEDTDLERSKDAFLQGVLQDLDWLGLHWDEGPELGSLADKGSHGPYRQSKRLDIYNDLIDQLLKAGKAYYCFMTDQEIEAQKEEAQKEGRPYQVVSPYRDWDLEDLEKKIEEDGVTPAIRFRIDSEKKYYSFKDLVRGDVEFPSDMVGDFVVKRSNGMPVYNFVCAVDDALMKITHVFRAEEHLSNSLRQIMICQALGFELPEFGHLSIMLGQDRQKLSKRHGATSVSEFDKQGYIPQALLNFIALMGWSSPSGEEILSLETMTSEFTTERLNPASAVFDEEKLKWMNAQYLRAMPHKELWASLQPVFQRNNMHFEKTEEWIDRSLTLLKTSMETLTDAVELYQPLLEELPELDEQAKDVMSWESTKTVLSVWQEYLSNFDGEFFNHDDFKALQKEIKTKGEVKGKFLFMPLRVVLIGKAHGAEIQDLVTLMPIGVMNQRITKLLTEY